MRSTISSQHNRIAAAAWVGMITALPLWDIGALVLAIRAASALRRQPGRLPDRAAAALQTLLALLMVIVVAAAFAWQVRLPWRAVYHSAVLLLLCSLAGGLLATLLVSLAHVLERASTRRRFWIALYWWGAALASAIPTVVLGFLGGLAALRLHVIAWESLLAVDLTSASFAQLALAAGAVIPLPAFIAAHQAFSGRPAGASLLPTLAQAAVLFYRQAGWLLGGAALAETLLNIPGAGRILIRGITAADWPTVLGLMALAAVLVGAARLRAALAEMALGQPDGPVPQAPSSSGQMRPGIMFGALLILLSMLLAGTLIDRDVGALPDSGRAFAGLSAKHPLNTDHLGRDVLARLAFSFMPALLAAGAGGLVAAGLGALWAAAAWRLERRRTRHVLLALAEALIVLQPAAFVCALAAAADPFNQGVIVGLALAPRLAPALFAAVRSGTSGSLRSTGQMLLAALLAAAFVTLHITLMLDAVGLGLPEALPTPGGLLAPWRELAAALFLAPGTGMIRLSITLAAPALLGSLALLGLAYGSGERRAAHLIGALLA
jgi:peptide/nickel transport system permease protein